MILIKMPVSGVEHNFPRGFLVCRGGRGVMRRKPEKVVRAEGGLFRKMTEFGLVKWSMVILPLWLFPFEINVPFVCILVRVICSGCKGCLEVKMCGEFGFGP